MSPLTPDDLAPELSLGLSTQSYAPAAQIEGVVRLPLRAHRDDSGCFVEMGRLDQAGAWLGLPGFVVRQINHSTMLPGALKAWHLHLRQDDLWFVPQGSRVLVGLRDLRRQSPTVGLTQRLVLGGSPELLRIPAGVAHGLANPYAQTASLIYLVDQHFDGSDEHRLPWDLWGTEIWECSRG